MQYAGPSAGLVQVPSAQGKCTKQLHLGAPDKCTSIGQSPSGRAGRIWRSIEAGKHLTQDALEAAWEHDGHLVRASATSPTIWDASPSCGDILITNQPTKRADASFSAGAVLALDDISGEILRHRIKANYN